MKRLVLILFYCSVMLSVHAQWLDRSTVASGSVGDARHSVTIGEPCVFFINHDGGTLSGGAQCGDGAVSSGVSQSVEHTHWVLYPNPVVNRIYIQTDGVAMPEAFFKVFDTAGKLLLEHRQVSSCGLFQLDVSDLPQGSYILSVSNAQGTIVGQVAFVKSK